jgi:hypothetical protein
LLRQVKTIACDAAGDVAEEVASAATRATRPKRA